MDQKKDFAGLKKIVEEGKKQLNHEDLHAVAGGIELSPDAMNFAKSLVQACKNSGYTREMFINELNSNPLDKEYYQLYLDLWDSL